jgi:uncharacterized protein YkwD
VPLVAAILGAVTVGGMAVATTLSPGTLADPAVVQPAMLVVTTTPPKPTTSTTTMTTRPPHTTAHRAPTTTRTTTTPPPTRQDQVFALVNQARAEHGCRALTGDPRLTRAAQDHSDDMSAHHYFAHTTPSGVTFDERERAAGYPTPGGENIAEGQTSAQQVMTDWLNSPGHRANILNCAFTAIGIGVDTDGWYWTQDFGY